MVTSERLERFFSPRSIAVVGAFETSHRARNAVANLAAGGYEGRVFPVDPKRQSIFDVACVGSLRDLPESVDCVYVAAPIDAVPALLDDAAAAGIHNVVVAAGFGESGPHERQAHLIAQATRHDITILGPNSPGFLNVAEGVRAYGQDVPAGMKSGEVAVVVQGGALATVVLGLARSQGVGLSKFVCLGDEAVVEAFDVLDYLIADEKTRVIAMCLAQITEGGRFLALAHRALLAGKAIVVLKSRRTSSRASAGSVLGDQAIVDAALRQTGVARARSLEEMIVTAGFFASGVRLKGPRVAVITGSGGACDIIADRASDEGLEMPPFSPDTTAALEAYLPRFATVQNPLDTASVDNARETGNAALPMDVVAEIVGRDANFDFVLYLAFNVVPLTEPNEPERSRNIARMAHVGEMIRTSPLPVVPISLSCMEVGSFARDLYDANGIAMLGGIEFGLTSLGHALRWERARAAAARPAFARSGRSGPAPASSRRGIWSERQGRLLLEANGVPLGPATLVQSADEAVAAAEHAGYPVMLRTGAAETAQESDMRGAAPDLRNSDDVQAAFTSLEKADRASAGYAFEGLWVSPMRPRGVVLSAGVTVDPSFGPTLAVGLAGNWIDTLGDVGLRILPASEEDILVLLRSLQARPLLEGARGGPRVDLAKAAEAIGGIARASLSLGLDLQSLKVKSLWCLDGQVEALDVLVVTR